MNFNSFNLPVSTDLIQAFSWTLIHSLWQGLVLAIAAGVLLLATKKSRPALRYNLLTGLMLFFTVANVITFYLEFNWTGTENVVTGNGLRLGSSATVTQEMASTTVPNKSDSALQVVLNICSENAIFIVMVWLAVFLTKSVQAVSGLMYLNKLRKRQVESAAEHWQHKLRQLSRKINIRSEVLLLESEMVSVPAVIGFFKPVILVPIGFLTSLPYGQVEAILLHELAHIRRQDFLVNLFQSFAESIYFFNPAVIWVSRLIREEREHCCDDMAIAVMQNKKEFVNALVVFQQHQLSEQNQVIAFAGKRNHLLDRIKRIIYNNNKQLNAMEKLFVTASVLTVTALLAAFSPELPKPPKAPKPPRVAIFAPPAPPAPLAPPAPCDTVPEPDEMSEADSDVFTVHITRDNKRYEITEKSGKVTDLKINDKQIPKDKIANYLHEVKPILAEMKAESEKHQEEAEKLQEEAAKLQEEAEEMRAEAQEWAKEEFFLIKEDADRLKFEAELVKEDAERVKEQSLMSKEQAAIMQKHAQKIRKNVEAQKNQSFNINIEELKRHAEEMRSAAEELSKDAEIMKAEAEVLKGEAEKIKSEHDKMQSNFLNDLRRDGLIKNNQSISYKISEGEFILDGVKQSDAVHARYKKKYVKQKGSEMVYNWRGKGNTYTGYIHRK
jgi:bla regulator protein BlaR1